MNTHGQSQNWKPIPIRPELHKQLKARALAEGRLLYGLVDHLLTLGLRYEALMTREQLASQPLQE